MAINTLTNQEQPFFESKRLRTALVAAGAAVVLAGAISVGTEYFTNRSSAVDAKTDPKIPPVSTNPDTKPTTHSPLPEPARGDQAEGH